MRKLSEGLRNSILHRCKSIHKKKNEVWIKNRFKELSFDDFNTIACLLYRMQHNLSFSRSSNKITDLLYHELERFIIKFIKCGDIQMIEKCVTLSSTLDMRTLVFYLIAVLRKCEYYSILRGSFKGMLYYDNFCFSQLVSFESNVKYLVKGCAFIDMSKVDLRNYILSNFAKYKDLLCFNLNKSSREHLLKGLEKK
jgi:hypothetical protein